MGIKIHAKRACDRKSSTDEPELEVAYKLYEKLENRD